MKSITKNAILRFLSLCVVTLLLAACAEGGAGSEQFNLDGSPKLSNPDFVREFPPVALSGYDGRREEVYSDDAGRSGVIDLTNLSKGYVVAATTSPVNAKFQVAYGNKVVNYNLDNTGKYEVFPLTEGNGTYTFTIFLWFSGENYEYFLTVDANVTLESEFAPFLVPNQIVNYTGDSAAVALGRELTQNCSTDLEIVQMVYYWIKENIDYDTDKALEVVDDNSYLPDLDELLQTKKGICYDYAALAAAMLRSNGVPCKLIRGDVLSEGQPLAHAWNMFWTDETGWVAVKVPSTPNEWDRIDLTFAASNDPAVLQFIGDGENYTDIYEH